MSDDSMCIGIFATLAAIHPVPTATPRATISEESSPSGWTPESCPNSERMSASALIAVRRPITSTYIVTAPVTLSSPLPHVNISPSICGENSTVRSSFIRT